MSIVSEFTPALRLNPEIYPSNVFPSAKKITATDLKPFQRLAAAFACMETYEEAKTSSIDKEAHAEVSI